MQNNILFDNIYIGHSIEDAERVKAETWDIKHPIETAEDEASKPKPSETPLDSSSDLKFTEDPLRYVKERLDLFLKIGRVDPVQALKSVPEVTGSIISLVVIVIALIAGAFGSKGAAPPQVKKAAESVKQAATEAKDQVVDAASTGAEKIQTEVNKRTTRSSGPAE